MRYSLLVSEHRSAVSKNLTSKISNPVNGEDPRPDFVCGFGLKPTLNNRVAPGNCKPAKYARKGPKIWISMDRVGNNRYHANGSKDSKRPRMPGTIYQFGAN